MFVRCIKHVRNRTCYNCYSKSFDSFSALSGICANMFKHSLCDFQGEASYKNTKLIFQRFLKPTCHLFSQFSPSTMLVLAKKPDEAFKAPLNTKKQAPVTAANTKRRKRENNKFSFTNRPLTEVK